jgi:ACS family tartrate transporter-like MFS transporter
MADHSPTTSPAPDLAEDGLAANGHAAALDRARRKAYWRLLPLLFLCYMISYVDRTNVSIAKLTMVKDLPGFDNAVIGFGAGVFFLGYFLLEIPGALLVERWSARKWICRIMLTWGAMAALTALVRTPWQFYGVRFLLGLAEAGFFPGVVIYLTHWFPARDRSRALSLFLVATPLAQIVSPKISNAILKIGTDEVVNGVAVHHPEVLGMEGWQWVYIAWGVPAVVLGVVVLLFLTDRPRQATWLTPAERDALEAELEADRARSARGKRMTFGQALRNPQVLLLALAYFCTVSGTYSLEFFLPSILERWYHLKLDAITWLVVLPPCLALAGQLFVGWSSDRTRERRLHALVPIAMAVVVLAFVPLTQGNLALTVACFVLVFTGLKSYQPAFWSLPSLFLTQTAAAGSIGLINSVGNLGGFVGPAITGWAEKATGSFVGGIYYLCASIAVSVVALFFLGVGRREPDAEPRGLEVVTPEATAAAVPGRAG